MAVPGSWALHYDWNTTGNYASTAINIATNGTFTTGDGGSGTWVQTAGILTFQYNGLKTTYSGNIADKSVTGISSTFGGLNGSFYMLQQGAGAVAMAERVHSVANSSGTK